jgi:hypothetical protein
MVLLACHLSPTWGRLLNSMLCKTCLWMPVAYWEISGGPKGEDYHPQDGISCICQFCQAGQESKRIIEESPGHA